jgi:flavin-dependent dehydrogenase
MITRASEIQERYDVVVVGARPAGAGTALLLARQGARVLLIDRGRYGSDTLSTHALMRGGVVQLARWGVLPRIVSAETPAVTRATFIYGAESVAVAVKPRDGVDALYAPRRTVLDRALVDVAREAGVQVAYSTRALDVRRDSDGRVTGVIVSDPDDLTTVVHADLVIGADGMRSPVARMVGASLTHTGRWAGAVVFGYWSGLPVDGYRWYYQPNLGAGAIPTNDGLTCIFVSVAATRFAELFKHDVEAGYRRILAAAGADLREGMGHGRLHGSLHGFPGQVGFFRRSAGPGWALVGDAAYFKDPITAHGITDALIDAEYLAHAVEAGTDAALLAYDATRRQRVQGVFDVTDRIASYTWTLDEVRGLHRALAEEMSREVEALRALTLEAATT